MKNVTAAISGLLISGLSAISLMTHPLASSAAPADPVVQVNRLERPTGKIAADGCVTAECHANVKDFRVVHGPINSNSCEACHTAVDEAQHTFKFTRDKGDLCTFCHQIEIPKSGVVVHQPLKDGDCVQCHNPHGGKNNQFIRQDTMQQMCSSCHKDVVAGKSKVHGPVAADACGSCHSSHTAPYKNLLVAEGRELCLRCHSDMGQQLKQVGFVHKPVEGDCLQCHDAHASNFSMHIKQDPQELCSSCHEGVKKQMQATHQHSIVVQDQACLNCHTAHGGDRSQLMKADPVTMCLQCHDKPITNPDRTIASMKELLDPDKIKHGPIRDGNCGGCHAVHGSDVARLLNKPYPEKFYQAFSTDKYELCFGCHDKQLVEAEQAKGLTGFRNGSANLHFLHVNKSERGRNCRACHSTHASTNELHIAQKVPFGKWEMPINFRKTDSGGSCSPGCHKTYGYDRETPIVYESESKERSLP